MTEIILCKAIPLLKMTAIKLYIHFSCLSPLKAPQPQLPVATADNSAVSLRVGQENPQYAYSSNNSHKSTKTITVDYTKM